MLPPQNRLRHSGEFTDAVRHGRRAGGPSVVVHLRGDSGTALPPRVGFVVSKAVGGSVVRNRVARRLRAQMADRLERLPAGSVTVVRALPSASCSTSHELGRALDRTFDRLLDVRSARPVTP